MNCKPPQGGVECDLFYALKDTSEKSHGRGKLGASAPAIGAVDKWRLLKTKGDIPPKKDEDFEYACFCTKPKPK